MMRFNQLLVLLLLSGCFACGTTAQHKDSTFVELDNDFYEKAWNIEVEGTAIAVDPLQQFYITTPDNQFLKFSPEGEQVFNYGDRLSGDIALVDVIDPFNIMLYYQEFENVVVLDRTLTVTGNIDLYQTEIPDIGCVGLSSDRTVWMYDPVELQLKRIGKAGAVIYESPPLFQLDGAAPTRMMERNGQVYLLVDSVGLYQFDLFGAFIRQIELDIRGDFNIRDEKVMWWNENGVHVFDLTTDRKSLLPLPIDKSLIIDLEVGKNGVYLLTENGVTFYSYKK